MQAKLYWQQIVALASYDANFQVEYFNEAFLSKLATFLAMEFLTFPAEQFVLSENRVLGPF